MRDVNRRGERARLLPCGRSGLKFDANDLTVWQLVSPPVREEWIEIAMLGYQVVQVGVSSRAGGVD